MNFTQKLVDIIAPPGTSRRQFPELSRQAVATWKEEGPLVAIVSVLRTIQAHGYGLLVGFGILPNPHRFLEEPSYSYEEWITDHEPTAEELAAQPAIAASFTVQPTFSIITPVYNPPADVFTETIESVLAQTYPHWTLYLTDGGSDDPEVLKAMAHFSQLDSRIRVITLEQNLGISGNSNMALEQADGDFISLLDHDDLIAPNMLFEVASTLQESAVKAGANQIEDIPVDIIYFDEDKVSADGKSRRDPWMKPDFSPETLLSTNILMHCVLRRSLLVSIGGFNSEMDGAQDWDVALRCMERTDKIIHISKVLYHWRQIKGSAASDINAKPWAITAQAHCISAHLQRIGADDATVEMPKLGQIHIKWPHYDKRVSIIILTKDKPDLIRACLQSILTKTTYPNYEVIVVDTGSTDRETLDFYQSLANEPRVKIIERTGRFNFSAANNFGASHATGELLLFLNNDTEVISPDWLEEMAGWALRPEVGVVGARLTRPDGTLQHVGVILGVSGHAEHVFDGCGDNTYGSFGLSNWLRNYYAVTGACFMLRRNLFDELRGWDELYEIAFNDVDLCIRAFKAGYRNLCTPFAHLLHYEGESRGHYFPLGDLIRATLQMWPIIKAGDPHYNKNLSRYGKLPTLAPPDEVSTDAHMLRIWKMFDLVPNETENAPDQPGFHDHIEMLSPPPDWHKVQYFGGKALHECQRVLFVLSDSDNGQSSEEILKLVASVQSAGTDITIVGSSNHDAVLKCQQQGFDVELVSGLQTDMRVAVRVLDNGSYDGLCLVDSSSWRLIHAARAFNIPSFLAFETPEEEEPHLAHGRHMADAFAYGTTIS